MAGHREVEYPHLLFGKKTNLSFHFFKNCSPVRSYSFNILPLLVLWIS